jgi:zinc/manganese transport system ATP-binding protein
LLKGLAGLLKPLSGEILRHNIASHDIAYLPQATALDGSFPATVADLAGLGLWRKRGLFARLDHKDAHDIARALDATGLAGFAGRPIDTLSGGQLQRALFARAMLQDAQVILLDEPFTAVDSRTVSDLMQMVEGWHGQERTVIAVLHDEDMVRRHFPNAVLLAREVVAWGATADVLKPDNIMKARAMHEAWDEHSPWCEKDVA